MTENIPQPPIPPVPPPGVPRPPASSAKRPPVPPTAVKRPPSLAKVPVPPPVASFDSPAPVPSKPKNDRNDDRFDDVDDIDDIDDDFDNASPYDDNMAASFGLPPVFIKTKVLVPLFCLMILIGISVGIFVERSTKSSSPELPGVVNNPEIPKGRPRCGLARKGQGCVFYVMNPTNQEMMAKDFFEVAANFLKIPKFQVETANIQYATTRIPPGYIALFNITPEK